MPVRVRPQLVTSGQYSAAHGLRLDRLLPLPSRAKKLSVTPRAPSHRLLLQLNASRSLQSLRSQAQKRLCRGHFPSWFSSHRAPVLGPGRSKPHPTARGSLYPSSCGARGRCPKSFPCRLLPGGGGVSAPGSPPCPTLAGAAFAQLEAHCHFLKSSGADSEERPRRWALKLSGVSPTGITRPCQRCPGPPVPAPAACLPSGGPRYCPALGRDLKRSHASHQRTKHRAQWIAPRTGQRRDPASPRESFRQGVSFGTARPPPLCMGGAARKALPRRPREDAARLAGELSPILSREVGRKGSSVGRGGWVLGAGGYTGRTNPPPPKIASIKLTRDSHEEQKLTRGPLSQRHSPYCPLQASWDPAGQSQSPPSPSPSPTPPSLSPPKGRPGGRRDHYYSFHSGFDFVSLPHPSMKAARGGRVGEEQGQNGGVGGG